METTTHLKIKVLLLAAVSIILTILLGIQTSNNKSQADEIEQLEQTVKDTSSYYKNKLQSERIMSWLNGCYHAVEVGCSGRYKCIQKYNNACNVDAD